MRLKFLVENLEELYNVNYYGKTFFDLKCF